MESGKIHGLVGLNGAGKTTLLNTLYSFIRPSAGSVSYNDRSLKRQDIAYLEAENYFYPYMTCLLYTSSKTAQTFTWKKQNAS